MLDRVVPGYYQRLERRRARSRPRPAARTSPPSTRWRRSSWSTRSCSWARDYKVDGFRFDLMGHHSQGEHAGGPGGARRADAGARTASTARRSTSTARAGTSARSPTTPCSRRPPRASSAARASARSPTGCATPSAAAARSTTTRASRASAPASSTDPNGAAVNGAAAGGPLAARHRPGPARAGRQPARRSPSERRVRRDRARRPDRLQRRARRATPTSPDEVISYVDAHDNETLWDALTYKLPVGHLDGGPRPDEHASRWPPRPSRRRRRSGTRAPTCCAASRWTATATTAATGSTGSTGPGQDNGFGHGLPPKADNEAKWPYMKPLLADPALKPTAGRRRRPPRPRRRTCCGCGSPRRCSGSGSAQRHRAPRWLPRLRHRRRRTRAWSSCGSTTPVGHATPTRRSRAWSSSSTPRRRRGDAEGARAGRAPASRSRRCRPAAPTRWSRPRAGTRRAGRLTVPARTVAVFVQH